MKTLSHDQIARWASRWFHVKRPGIVKEFYITDLLSEFQSHLQESEAAPEKKESTENKP